MDVQNTPLLPNWRTATVKWWWPKWRMPYFFIIDNETSENVWVSNDLVHDQDRGLTPGMLVRYIRGEREQGAYALELEVAENVKRAESETIGQSLESEDGRGG